LREEVYKIRYQVYCQELGYEREENCQNGMEQDIYDGRSIHCLLLHLRSGLYAGCVRLVLPDPQAKDRANLPCEKIFAPYSRVRGEEDSFPRHSSQSNSIKLNNLLRHCGGLPEEYSFGNTPPFGEVSRLAVTSKFRKRNGEDLTSHGVAFPESEMGQNERRYFPLIALGLYLAATSVAIELGLDSALTLMEPRLARHLKRFGIKFAQIGELVEFRGQRGLFQISREAALNGMNSSTYELFQMLRSEVKKSLGPSANSQPHSTAA